MDELIDIFDENQKFIGREMKSVAHKLGHWHKSIHAYIINSKNEIIIQKRSANKDFYPNVWDVSVGGHISAGEDSVLTVIRECQEELGITISPDEIQYICTTPEKFSYGNVKSYEFAEAYLCKTEFGKITKQDEEVDDVKVIPVKEFISMIENKAPELFPHYDEYVQVLPVLK